MTHPDMAALFDLLDQWRHLPSYRLESRADAVFGLFLPHALDRHLAPRGIAIDPRIIPEFPLGQGDTKRSDKADFFAVSRDREHAFLVELKTDMGSLRDAQENYLNRAIKRGLAALLRDIRSMAKARNPQARRKYFHLLKAIAELDLMILPGELQNPVYDSPRGVFVIRRRKLTPRITGYQRFIAPIGVEPARRITARREPFTDPRSTAKPGYRSP